MLEQKWELDFGPKRVYPSILPLETLLRIDLSAFENESQAQSEAVNGDIGTVGHTSKSQFYT